MFWLTDLIDVFDVILIINLPSIRPQEANSAMSSIGDRNRHNPQDRPRQSLAGL